MDESEPYLLHPIGVVRSTLRAVARAPNQAFEGAPEALLEIDPALANALHRIEPGDELIVLTWLHLADRRVLQTHPTGDVPQMSRPAASVQRFGVPPRALVVVPAGEDGRDRAGGTNPSR